jgi:serine beta-lactamase-like protein LACTB, mitochondrial
MKRPARTEDWIERYLLIVVALCWLSGGAGASAQQSTDVSLPGELSTALLEGLGAATDTPGLAAAVAVGGKVVWHGEYGLADLENGARVTPLTLFRLGSVSKSITAATLVLLAQRGGIDLDQDIRPLVPAFPDKGYPITPRQLAGHLAGIRHYEENESISYEPVDSITGGLSRFQDSDLLQAPGSAYKYSTYGYTLLGAAIEAACGRPFEDCVKDLLLDPIGLESVFVDRPSAIISFRTRFYARSDGEVVNAPFSDRTYKVPGGAYLASAGELARFGSALVHGDLLTPTSRDALFSSQRTASGDLTGYGMGFRPREDWLGRPVVHHGGDSEGGRAFLLIYPREQVVVTLLGNRSGAPLFEQEAQTFASYFLDAPERAAQPLPAGTYTFEYKVKDEVRHASLELTGQPDTPGWLLLEATAPIKILSAISQDERFHLVGAGREGVLNMWVALDESSITGRWDWYGRTAELSGHRVPEDRAPTNGQEGVD